MGKDLILITMVRSCLELDTEQNQKKETFGDIDIVKAHRS